MKIFLNTQILFLKLVAFIGKYYGFYQFIFSSVLILLVAYIFDLRGIIWYLIIGYFNFLIFFNQSTAIYLSMFISLPILGFLIHVYTVIFAFRESLISGIITIFTPFFSEIYWFIQNLSLYGTIKNTYCIVLILYLIIQIQPTIRSIDFLKITGKLDE